MQEEVDQKTIALAIKTGKLTGQVLQAAMKKFLAARQKSKAKIHHGKQSLRQLKKDGSALSNIEITDANIGLFRPCACLLYTSHRCQGGTDFPPGEVLQAHCDLIKYLHRQPLLSSAWSLKTSRRQIRRPRPGSRSQTWPIATSAFQYLLPPALQNPDPVPDPSLDLSLIHI